MMRKTAVQLAGALGHEAADKRVEILRRVAAAGSISQAARAAGVSYKAAWQALQTLSTLAGAALVERAVGGAGGGGARLTPAGEQVIRAADAVARARGEALAGLGVREHAAQGSPALAALALRTSMRNQLPAIVERLRPQAGALRIDLRLADGQPLASRITRESAQLLGLAPGVAVLALCKATAVVLAGAGQEAGEDNLLRGIVRRVSKAAAGGEFVLAMGEGQQLVGFAGPSHGLRSGAGAAARIPLAAVVIALPG